MGKAWLHPHEVLLERELLVVVAGRPGRYTVTLTRERLILSGRGHTGCLGRGRGQLSLLSRDIVSVRPPHQEPGQAKGGKKKRNRRGKQPVFMLVAFPSKKTGGLRARQQFFFQLPRGARREEAAQITRLWLEAVSQVCLGRAPEELALRPPLIVLVNPSSGRGRSEAMWRRAVAVLQEAGVVWEVLATEGPGHAQQILTTLDLASWGGVVVVSGDGLVHEVYNGLLARADWSEALGFPVGVIPGGSGNALVRSLVHWQGEAQEPDQGLMSQCVSVARANLAPLDLFVVRRTGAELRVGFLSLGWGLIPDVDLDSEAIRWMGSLRFTVYGLAKVARRRLYRGSLSYVLADWPERQQPRTMQVPIHPLDSSDSDWTSSLEPPSILPYPRHLSQPPHSALIPPPTLLAGPSYAQSWQELDERLCQHTLLARDEPVRRQASHRRESRGRGEWDKPPGRMSHSLGREVRNSSPSKGRRRPRRTSEPRSSVAAHRNQATPTAPTPTGIPPAAPAPVFPTSIPHPPSPRMDPTFHPLTATPLHKDWVTETSDYLCVFVLNLPYLDRTFFAAPDSCPDDGVLWLLIVRSSVTRASLIKFMLAIESGAHVNIPGVDIFPVTAVKIQPEPSGLPSNMTLDGERLTAGPVQCQVLPGAGRVMVK